MKYDSLRVIAEEIEKGHIATMIEEMEEKLRKNDDDKVKSVLCLHLALCYLQLETVRKAIRKCRESVEFDKDQGLAYFIEGVAYLWTDQEEKALETWSKGIPNISDLYKTSTLRNIVFDHNFREFVYKHKFDILTIINIYDNYGRNANFCDSDIETAYAELKHNSLFPALTYFSLVLKRDPNNFEAIRGRGVVYCLLTQWRKCIEDLDREFPPELENDALKFCAIAMASIGNLFMGVSKISRAIQNSPIDFESIAERAKMQMMRGCFSLALKDFRSVPEQCYTDRIWLYIAECLYSIGDIPKATEAIERAQSENDHRKGYCHFLILRDRGLREEAKQQIIETTQIMPSFFLLRIAGDYMMDIGEYYNAAHYYEAALQQKGEDAETKRLYGLALFQSGQQLESHKVLQELQSGWCTFSCSADTCPSTISGFCIDGPLLNFNQSIRTKDVLENATLDFVWIHKLIKLWTKSSLGAARDITSIEDAVNDAVTDPPLTEDMITEFEITPQLEKLIADADNFGARCAARGPEIVENPRVTRALGFCVLYLAQFLRMIWLGSTDQHWKDAFDQLRIILSFADMRCNVQWRDGESTNPQTPTYIIQRGERRSPRFGYVVQNAIQQIRHSLSPKFPTDLCQLTTLDNLYGIAQGDVAFSSLWSELTSPTVSLRSLGNHGYQLSVTPPTDKFVIDSYEATIQKTWAKLLTREKNEKPVELGMMMLLIWCLHPFTHYSNELAHVLLHAYALARNGTEIERLDDTQGEIFIKQMIQPNQNGIQNLICDHLSKKLPRKYSDESLSFWNTLPQVGNLMTIMSYNLDSLPPVPPPPAEVPFTQNTSQHR